MILYHLLNQPQTDADMRRPACGRPVRRLMPCTSCNAKTPFRYFPQIVNSNTRFPQIGTSRLCPGINKPLSRSDSFLWSGKVARAKMSVFVCVRLRLNNLIPLVFLILLPISSQTANGEVIHVEHFEIEGPGK